MNWIVVAVVDVLKICISGSVSVCLFYLKFMRKMVATTCSDCNRSYLKINEIDRRVKHSFTCHWLETLLLKTLIFNM